MTDGRTPPRAALALGYAGLLPPSAAIAVELMLRGSLDQEPSGLMIALPALGYVALILSFLGGTWWGIVASRARTGRLWGSLAMAVAPSLAAAGAFCSGWLAPQPRGTAVMLAVAIMLTLFGDRRLARAGLTPPWWMTLRIPLSCALALEALAVGLLA